VVAESKIEGLKNHCAINSPRACAYFDVHTESDKEYPRVARELLNRYVDGNNAAAVKASVGPVLEAPCKMLSGVERRHPLAASRLAWYWGVLCGFGVQLETRREVKGTALSGRAVHPNVTAHHPD
jgi:hypothetical protein